MGRNGHVEWIIRLSVTLPARASLTLGQCDRALFHGISSCSRNTTMWCCSMNAELVLVCAIIEKNAVLSR